MSGNEIKMSVYGREIKIELINGGKLLKSTQVNQSLWIPTMCKAL